MKGRFIPKPFPLFIVLHRHSEDRHWTVRTTAFHTLEKAEKEAKLLEKLYKHTTVRQIQELTEETLEQPRET